MSEIDVSKCIFRNKEWGNNCDICQELVKSKLDRYGNPRTKCLTVEDIQCKSYPDCYYKQLQKLKAENEELKDTVICLRVELDKQKTRLKEHIARLEQENEELKSEIRQKKMTIMMNNDHYHNVDIQNRKYKKYLDDIEVILKETKREIYPKKETFEYLLQYIKESKGELNEQN